MNVIFIVFFILILLGIGYTIYLLSIINKYKQPFEIDKSINKIEDKSFVEDSVYIIDDEDLYKKEQDREL